MQAYSVEDVRILERGLMKWIKEGRPVESGEAHPKPRVFTPRLDASFVGLELREADVAESEAGRNTRRADLRARDAVVAHALEFLILTNVRTDAVLMKPSLAKLETCPT